MQIRRHPAHSSRRIATCLRLSASSCDPVSHLRPEKGVRRDYLAESACSKFHVARRTNRVNDSGRAPKERYEPILVAVARPLFLSECPANCSQKPDRAAGNEGPASTRPQDGAAVSGPGPEHSPGRLRVRLDRHKGPNAALAGWQAPGRTRSTPASACKSRSCRTKRPWRRDRALLPA
jgi:hypothetical protein